MFFLKQVLITIKKNFSQKIASRSIKPLLLHYIGRVYTYIDVTIFYVFLKLINQSSSHMPNLFYVILDKIYTFKLLEAIRHMF